MFLKTSSAVFAATTALAFGAPVASAVAAGVSGKGQGNGSPRCPAGYVGPTNLATGCPYWMMS
jgi:hypothetical protein